MIMNRRFAKTLLPAVLLLGCMFDANAADKATLNGWTIEAGKIKSSTSRTEPHSKQVSGSFELKNKADPTQTRRAGACLLADLVDQGVGLPSCSSDKECNDAYDLAPNPQLGTRTNGPHLYCLGEKPSSTEKRCWIRPGPDSSHCSKGLYSPGSHAVPAPVAGQPDSAGVAADPLGNGQDVNWRVMACLNPDNGLPPACAIPGSTNKVYSQGKIKKVKP
jgi:hypothetical protein